MLALEVSRAGRRAISHLDIGRNCSITGASRWRRGAERSAPGLRGAALVSVMKTTDLGNCNDGSARHCGCLSMIGRVFVEAEVGTRSMVVIDVRLEDAPKVRLVQDDHVIETLSPDRAD